MIYKTLKKWNGFKKGEEFNRDQYEGTDAELVALCEEGTIELTTDETIQPTVEDESGTDVEEAATPAVSTYKGLVINSHIDTVERSGRTYKSFSTVNGQTFLVDVDSEDYRDLNEAVA